MVFAMVFIARGFLGICCLGFVVWSSCDAVPLSLLNSNTVEEVIEDDDFTTHTLERLSSAATCLVKGVEYTHGQQIHRDDPCEFCLCLDGEMFCWWQDCPPTLEGPCRERNPYSPCLNGPRSSSSSSSSSAPPRKLQKPTTTTTSTTTTSTQTARSEAASETITFSNGEYSTDFSSVSEDDGNSTEEAASSTTTPAKVCVVMGRTYQIGARLPHNTGNCVECICGPNAQITCSPHHCAPAEDDMVEYRPPGPRQSQRDVF